MKTYQEMKQSHSLDIDNFQGIFFAFNKEQFIEGMQKIGLTINDKNKIYSIGCGGYILKSKFDEFSAMLERHQKEVNELKQDEDLLLSALVYELQNHEYCISYDCQPALEALGFTKEDIDIKILNKAMKLAV